MNSVNRKVKVSPQISNKRNFKYSRLGNRIFFLGNRLATIILHSISKITKYDFFREQRSMNLILLLQRVIYIIINITMVINLTKNILFPKRPKYCICFR